MGWAYKARKMNDSLAYFSAQPTPGGAFRKQLDRL
jgi:hypothetical protein